MSGQESNVLIGLSSLERAKFQVKVYERLAEHDPEYNESKLMERLNELMFCYGASGCREEVLSTAERALKINEHLARMNPGAFLPKLAINLSNVGRFYSGFGRHGEALAASGRSLEIHKQLARSKSRLSEIELARSYYDRGVILTDAGEDEAAADAMLKGVYILKRHFLDDQNSVSHLMMLLVERYRDLCEVAGLEPIFEAFQCSCTTWTDDDYDRFEYDWG